MINKKEDNRRILFCAAETDTQYNCGKMNRLRKIFYFINKLAMPVTAFLGVKRKEKTIARFINP